LYLRPVYLSVVAVWTLKMAYYIHNSFEVARKKASSASSFVKPAASPKTSFQKIPCEEEKAFVFGC
jgi:hypothetical protein